MAEGSIGLKPARWGIGLRETHAVAILPDFLSYALGTAMKEGIHPNYNKVVFQDVTSSFSFLTRSTLSSKETVKWEDGETYPLIKVDISSASHPFYTGKSKQILDTAGRVDRFRKRYAK